MHCEEIVRERENDLKFEFFRIIDIEPHSLLPEKSHTIQLIKLSQTL